jgi:hypothetical protein
MTAAAISAALGDARRDGPGWRYLGSLHRGRILMVSDGWTGPRASSAIRIAWLWRSPAHIARTLWEEP